MRVYVERDRVRLRIRIVYQGKKHQFSTGLMDTKTNRSYVQGIASRIELDMVSGQFDPTLLKYRPNAVGSNPAGVSCPELFRRFTEHQFKAKGLAPGSRRRYQPIQSCLEQRLNVPAHQVSDRTAGNYAALLLERLTARSAKERLWMLASCWDWAQGRYHVADENPWTAQVQRIKPQPLQKVKPFTAAEVKAIIGAFRSSSHYSHYVDFVSFLFGVGCRFGEAAGLQWKHVADDFQTVWIGESVSRGYRKSTKTGKARTVMLSPMVAKMLGERLSSRKLRHTARPDDLVFPSPKGLPIDDHNFRNRAWKTILERCHVEYRKPYAVRHSAISHALASGANPMDLAEQTGHDKRVLLSTYAHAITKQSLFVEF
jgi:integrase